MGGEKVGDKGKGERKGYGRLQAAREGEGQQGRGYWWVVPGWRWEKWGEMES